VRMEKLAKIYRELLKVELKDFLQYLLDSNCLIEAMKYTDWDTLINSYLEK